MSRHSRSPQPYRKKKSEGKLEDICESEVPTFWSPLWANRCQHWSARMAHPTHTLAQFRTVAVCTGCMAWTKEQWKTDLRLPCPGTDEQPTTYQKYTFRRLKNGKYPTRTGSFASDRIPDDHIMEAAVEAVEHKPGENFAEAAAAVVSSMREDVAAMEEHDAAAAASSRCSSSA